MIRESIEKYAARQARRKFHRKKYTVVPARMRTRLCTIENVRAVLWDVYGTLLAVAFGDIESSLARKETMREAFRLTAKEFGLARFLGVDPAGTLMEMYVREIDMTHRRKRSHGVYSPEVRIEHIWLRILRRLESRGYKPPFNGSTVTIGLAFKVGYFFDDVYHAKVLYAGARETLEDIKKLGLKQGIISNAQFYTPIALKMLLRGTSNRETDPLTALFDKRLIFFSHKLGVSKPNPLAFTRARDRLKRMKIAPERVLYVGNDMCNDMVPARAVGFKCILFTGDRESLTLRKNRPECVDFEPDAVIKALPDLLKIIQ